MANVLGELFGDIAAAIREKTGDAATMKPAEFPEKISGIEAGADVSGVTATAADILEGKTLVDSAGQMVEGTIVKRDTPSSLDRTLTPSQESVTIEAGYYPDSFDVEVLVHPDIVTVEPGSTLIAQSHFYNRVRGASIPEYLHDTRPVTAAAEDVFEGKVIVDAEGNVLEGKIKQFDASRHTLTAEHWCMGFDEGYYKGYTYVEVVPESKTATPTKEQQTIKADDGKILSEVIVEPIPAEYPDVSGVTATAEDVIPGKQFVDAEGNLVEGAMPVLSGNTIYMTPAHDTSHLMKGYSDGTVVFCTQWHNKTVTPTKETQIFAGTSSFIKDLTVDPIPDEYQDVSNVTATAEDVRAGKVFVDTEGNEIEGALTGTIADVSETTATAEDVVEGKIFVDNIGNKVMGALAPSGGGTLVIKRGTFTANSVSQTVTHGLGTVPLIVWLRTVAGISSTTTSCIYCSVGVSKKVTDLGGITEDMQYSVIMRSDGNTMQNSPDYPIDTTNTWQDIHNANENTITFGSSIYGLKTGTSYTYTVVGLQE